MNKLRGLLVIIIVVGAMFDIAGGQFNPRPRKPRPNKPPVKKIPSPAPAPQSQSTRPAAAVGRQSAPVYQSDEITANCSAGNFLKWKSLKVESSDCLVSPVIKVGREYEINHHRVIIDFSGSGSVELSVAHSASDDLTKVLEKKHLYSRFQKVVSGKEILVSSPYKGERCAWIIVRITREVTVDNIKHVGWRGKNTLYGHVGRDFSFAGGNLPYRIMYPRNYDRSKSYPLVISVHGSGGVGTDNIKNLEQVILARYLFTNYYNDDNYECFSVVPQILPNAAIPAPYHPAGQQGEPSVFHPDTDWHAVNEQGYYTQATLALIQALIKDKAINIDPQRVYFTGFSYGGKACWEFLKAAPDLFAGAISCGGWPMGRCYSDPRGQMLEQLKKEVSIYKHVPLRIFAGELDRMNLGSRAVGKELVEQGADVEYIEFPKTNHVSSAGKAWGNKEYISWLFNQKKPAKKIEP